MYIHDTLLLACGSPNSRSALRNIFEDSYNLLEADNTHQTLMLLEQNHPCIAAVLIDYTILEKLDVSAIAQIEALSAEEEIPAIVFMDGKSTFTASLAYEHGAVDVISIPYDPGELYFRVQNIVNLYRHKWYLEEQVEEQTDLLRHFNDSIVDALASIIEHRSVESGRHILRIRRFTQLLLEEVARNCPEYGLTRDTIRMISSASALHDVGKISIPDSILNKPGKLTAEEWSVMKQHPLTGCQILETFHDVVHEEYLKYAHNICHYHHERWNGGGYPEGISGNAIPICAQVVGLADAYDALTTKRVYKDAYSFDRAANMILNGDCGIFSPRLLECFKAIAGQFEETARAYADGIAPQAEDFDVSLPVPDSNESQNALQRLQHKYQTLLHHINAAAIEADLGRNIFHLVYNPYPDLAPLGSGQTLTDILDILHRLIITEDHNRLLTLIHDDIPRLMNNETHHVTCHLRTPNLSSGYPNLYQVTLLNSSSDNASQRLLVLCRKENPHAHHVIDSPQADEYLNDNVINGLLQGIFVYRMDQWLTITDIGTQLEALSGYTQEDIQARFHNRFIEMIIPEDREHVRTRISEQRKYGRQITFSCRIRHKNGCLCWFQHKAYLETLTDGQSLCFATLTDITQSVELQSSHLLTLEQYQTILNLKNNIIFDWNLSSDHITVSGQWENIFGYPPISDHLVQQLNNVSHFHPEDIPVLQQHIHALQSGSAYQAMEARIAKADGRYLWCRLQATAVQDTDGTVSKIVGTLINIDEEKRTAKNLQDQAERDALTRLLNKNTARNLAEEFLSSSGPEANCAFLIIDLDNFKHINDRYGHLFGDTVLAQAAREIKKLFRTQDIVARIGGDEFLVIMRGMSDPELIAHRCSGLLSALRGLFRKQLAKDPIGSSIGISLCPKHGRSYQELFQHADQALYLAKDAGKNQYHFYDSVEFSSFRNRQIETTALNARIDSDELPGLANNSITQYILQQLHKSDDPEITINSLMQIIGEQIHASRVYIFENSPDNLYCSNTFEWCASGIKAQMNWLQNISYQTDIPDYARCFDENGVFYCSDISDLEGPIHDILAPQNVRSILQCAIMDNGVFRGFVGFDECDSNRFWTREEIDTLTLFSRLLSNFLLKERAKALYARRAGELMNILDHHSALVYAVDPETYELRYLNKRLAEYFPALSVGMRCYEGLMQKTQQCQNCPLRNIYHEKSKEYIFQHPVLNTKVLCEYSLVKWDGKDTGLVFCRQLPENITI